MTDRTQPSPEESSEGYQRGYQACLAAVKRDLATTLRLHAVKTGSPEEEILSKQKVREIFAGTFDVMSADEEFGPEPTGFFNVTKLAL